MAENEIAVRTSTQIERRSFAPQSVDEAFKFANMILVSGMAPKSYQKLADDNPEAGRAAIVVALQFGMEVGLAPLQALQNVANINGYPSLWGDAALALVRASGLLEWIEEDDFPVIREKQSATCRVKRRGDPIVKSVTFSYADAKEAGIFGNAVWKTYPYRMCQMRSRAFALRDKFSDVLKGLRIAEEVQDYTDLDSEATYPSHEPRKSQEVQQSEEAQAEPEVVDEPIGAPGATEWFKAYKASGWTRADADAFIKEAFCIEPPRDSRNILKSQMEAAMKWATTPRPAPATGENPDAEPA